MSAELRATIAPTDQPLATYARTKVTVRETEEVLLVSTVSEQIRFFPRESLDFSVGSGLREQLRELADNYSKATPFVGPMSSSPNRADGLALAEAPLDTGIERKTSKSPWATAVGPVLTEATVVREFGLSPETIRQSIEAHVFFSIRLADGNEVLPAMQFQASGRPVDGLRWVISKVADLRLPAHSIGAWLNKPNVALEGRSPWQEMRDSGLSGDLKSAVSGFVARQS